MTARSAPTLSWAGARWGYVVPRALTGALLAVAAVEWVYALFGPPNWWWAVADDMEIYTRATERMLSGGSWYLERQLTGPYPLMSGDVLYPPVTALFFAPWIVLPFVLYLAIPIAVTAWVVYRWQPNPWAWVLMALCILWPFTLLKVGSGNPNVWVMMLVALGLRYRWPGALILLKPSFLPLALIGIRSRGWWVAAAALAVLSLPFLADTIRYPEVVLNVESAGLLYSMWDVPLVLIPVIAWVSREAAEGRPDRAPSEHRT
jgi:hypothetical protein